MSGAARCAPAFGLLLLASPAWGQQGGGTAYKFAHVTAIASGAVTINVGSGDGLRQWTRVEVVRGARAVAVLKIVALQDHAATCEITSRPIPLRIGEYVRFLPSGAPSAAVAVAPAPPVPGPPPSTPAPRAMAGAPPRAPAAAPPAPPRAQPSPRIVTPAPGHAGDSAPAAAAPRPAAAAAPAAPAPTPPPRVAPPAARPAAAAPVTPPAAAPPPPARAVVTPGPAGSQTRMARVTFVTTSTAYVSAGLAEGLTEGSALEVVRRGRSVGQLKATFLSTHQAACQMVTVSDSVVVGDSVRYTAVATALATAVATSGTAVPQRQVARRSSRSRTGRLSGRVGLYYLTVIQRDSFGGQFSQPSGDIRLMGAALGGSPIGLMIDVRSRRLVQAFPGSPKNTTDQTRVYQAALSWQAPGSSVRFTTGRQYAPGITAVGLLDGAALEIGQSTWDYGLFAGMQPELVNLGFSNDISQLGGYVRRHSRTGSTKHWSLTAGATGSYLQGSTNREYLYLQASYLSRHVSVYAVQEMDYYRPWRRITGEKAISPTSTFANIQLQLTSGVSLTTGVDNRRNPLLYRDVVNPATEFDDTFRQGVWAGFALRSPRHFRMSFDARTNHDATTGTANTYTLALAAERLTPVGISVRSRSTRYTTGPRDGWLNSISFGLEPWGRGSIAVTSGWRSERDSTAAPTLDIRWLSADMDVSIARSLFAIVSAYRETGGIEAHDLLYAGLSFRF
jgi:hypothetical protein